MVEPIKKAVGLSDMESLALVKVSATALVAAWEDAEKLQDALGAARRERRRLETEAGELRELNLQQRAMRQEAVDSAEKAAAERDKWQKRAELCLEDDNKMAHERNEAVRKLTEAERRIETLQHHIDDRRQRLAGVLAERDDLKGKLLHALGHAEKDMTTEETLRWMRGRLDLDTTELRRLKGKNDMLRGQNEQLQQRLREMKASIIRSGGVGPMPPDWRKTREAFQQAVAARIGAQFHRPDVDQETVATSEVWKQAIDDSAEPQFTDREMSDAKAIVEEEAKYQRTARGEPVTDECPQCGGIGSFDLGRTPLAKGIGKIQCDRCKGSGRVLVQDAAPKHLDTEREGATDAAASGDLDLDSD